MDEEFTFNEEYEKLTTGTRAHANEFNKIFDKLFENDKFLKYAADSLAEKMLEKGMIVDNFTSERGDLPGSAANDKRLYDMIAEQNNNINAIPRLNIESNTTITDVANWLFAQFQTGIRPLNIFQASNIVVFDETGNFNIICTKFVDGDQLTGIAVNHWTGNTFSFAIDYDKVTWHWKRLVTNSDLSWKTLGYYEQGVEVSLPSSFTELLVVIYINGWAFTLPITYITLTDSERGYLGGSTWNTSSNYYGYHVNCSKTKIILRNTNFGGTTAEAKAMAVYYR
ncbi:MAG: hypothetical protein KH020_16905 [Clostridiales bacterium]|nr:hypothetical protein [Clostridiales bacterium]